MKPQTTKEYNQMKKEILKVVIKNLPQKFSENSFFEMFKQVEKEKGWEIVTETGRHFLSFDRHHRFLEQFPKEGNLFVKGG